MERKHRKSPPLDTALKCIRMVYPLRLNPASRRRSCAEGYKVIFLDRDGVINRGPAIFKRRYVTEWRYFKFLPGVKNAVRKLTVAGYSIYIISNQAGISKGCFSRTDMKAITANMVEEFKKAGGRITGVFYCPHKDEDNCGCRKPKTGLFEKAVEKSRIDFKKTFFIGDSMRDMQAGRAAGCKTILVLCGKESLKNKKNWRVQPDYVKRDLPAAVNWILKETQRANK